VWVDRQGILQELDYASGRGFVRASSPRLSPDENLVALQINDEKRDIWLYGLARGTMIRLTHEGVNSSPLWSPDGTRVVYQSMRGGRSNLFWQEITGRGPAQALTPSSAATQYPGSFAPDGETFLYSEIRPETARDIFVLPLDGEQHPRIYLQTPDGETTPRLSPDGRFVAYVSDESGRNEVYVQPFSGSGIKHQVSTDGGAEVVWAKRGGEIFYRSGGRMMAVQVKTEPSLGIGLPQLLFEGLYLLSSGPTANYDVSTDGTRFLMLAADDTHAASLAVINIVQNWPQEVQRKMPAQ
jgi:serine/threonine-protein kinase